MKKIKSTLNGTTHCNAICFSCGWNGGNSSSPYEARLELFRHMRKRGCTDASLEVVRTSHYKLEKIIKLNYEKSSKTN